MRNIKNLGVAALLFLLGSAPAVAATCSPCFWIGGTGTWDDSTDSAHWSASTGGASCGSPCTPVAGAVINFDGSSGAGTVTVNANLTHAGLTLSAYTGTLDFSVNNNNITLTGATAFVDAATGVHTLKMGNGTWTINTTGSNSTPWNVTAGANFTLTANGSTILINGAAAIALNRTFAGGAHTYNNLNITGAIALTGSNGWGTLTLTAPTALTLANGTTQTVATLADSGAALGAGTNNFLQNATTGSTGTTTILSLTNPITLHYTGLRGITVQTSALTCQNCVDGGGNSGNTGGSISFTSTSGGGGYVF